MTDKEFENTKFYFKKKLYWLRDIEKEVLSVNYSLGLIECTDGDTHHYSQLENKVR